MAELPELEQIIVKNNTEWDNSSWKLFSVTTDKLQKIIKNTKLQRENSIYQFEITSNINIFCGHNEFFRNWIDFEMWWILFHSYLKLKMETK